MKDKHTSKNHASFTPQRQNKYSIRKFTFGTASILVGATLFLGVNHDAKAAENVPTSTEISTTPDPGQEVEQAHADEVAFEAEVLNDSVVKTDEESTTVKKEEIQEEGGQVENTSLPENQPSNENTEKAVEEKHLEPKVQNAAPKSENVQVSKEKVSVPQPTIVKETEETNKIDLNSAIKIDQVKDLETATNFYAQSAGVSIADAKEFIKDLNLKESITPAELQQALIYQLSLEYETMYHPVAVIEGTERKDVKIIDGQRTTNYAAPLTINNPDVILADAMLNGYVSSGSDELSKAHLISGRAWMTDQGIPSVGTNGLTPVPVNTPVFLQWMDRDGAISPIYLAYTHNRNNDDSAQDGPGGYAFDLRNGWTDAKGKKHLYSAFAGQKYRFAIPDFTLPNGNRATMLRQSGGFYPGVFVDTFTINNMGQTPVVGKNIGRTGIFMAEVPVGNYMTKPKNQWVEANGNHSDPGILAIDGYNIVRGRVWMESSGGDRSNSATGPNFNPNMGDKAANGYKVVFSSLTTQGASAYRNAVERLPEDQRATAAKRLLQDHPEYISATVVATTDSSGVYAAKFPSGTLNVEHIYGFVLNPKGKLVQTYSGFTSPEFRRANQNIEIAPIAAPYSGIQQWANVNFAVVLSPSDTIDIATKPYNATNNPAAPGNRVEVELTNGDVPPMPTHIEWRDKNGNVVSKSRDFTTPKEGEKVGGFTIPNNAEEGDTYTAVLVSGGNDIGGDTVVVHVTDSNKYPPKATVVNKAFGQPTNENDVISHVTFPNYPANHKKPNVVVDHPDQLPDGSVPGRVEVPVTVTYPDGSTATIKVPVVTADQQDKDKYQPTTESIEKNYGEKATPDEVKGKVTVPNFPANGKQPTYTVDEAKIPNGLKSGTENVPVTVTYPDGSKEVVEVPVITKEQLDKDKYQPTTEEIRKPFGQRTDENEVKSKVAIPGYPENGQPVTITVDTSKIPDGQTPGEVNVPVTVTYPDNTTDVVNVKVTTGPKDSDTYQPTTAPITKPYGQGTTEQEIKDKVTVPNFPKDGVQPKVVIDDPTKVPDGNTTGVFDVPVTVTYPDGTTDKVTVKVTVGKQADNAKYEPTAEDITKKFGQKATPDEVKGKVTVPGFPKEGNQPVLTVDESKIPNGQTPGEVNVPVTVTYPDKTTDVVNVKVTTGPKDSDTYQPTTTPITKPYGQGTTEQEVKDKVTVPNFPKDGIQPKVVIDDPTKVPDGNTTGVFDVPVTVTYPDGTTDKTSVKVTVGKQADNAKYDPKAGEITKKFGQKATPDEVKGKVTVPGFPKDGDQPVLTVDETKIPNGQTPGEVNVPVTVTYPDKTTDVVNVKVTTGPKDSDTYQPTTEPITKPYGQGTTE
ncbi:Rib/alpha-like domain-containing protein, partial [Staphylococcus piscifermentans]